MTVNLGGRPPKYDLDKEADDLLAWSKLETSINLYGFTTDKDYLAQELTDFAGISDKFRLVLKKVKETIACRRERLVHEGKMHFGVYSMTARLHDRAIKEELEEEKDCNHERAKDLISHKAKVDKEKVEVSQLDLVQLKKALESGEISQK